MKTQAKEIIPDFKLRRSLCMKDIQYPVAISINEVAFAHELNRLKEMCSSLNQIIEIYQTEFNYKKNFEDFKNLLLPIIIKMPDEKVLIRDFQARWLSEQGIQIQLTKGLKLNRDKELQFLVDAYDFPIKFGNKLKSIFRLTRNCFIPDAIKFSQLYSEDKNQFMVSDEIEDKLKVKHTRFARTEEEVEFLYLRYQLADALNRLTDHGFGLGHVPYPFTKLLTVDGTDKPNSTAGKFYFRVDPDGGKGERILPDVKIDPDSINDPNEYDEKGKLKLPYQPITLKAVIDGFSHDLKITAPQLIIPGISQYHPKLGPLPILAKDMARNEEIVKELLFDKTNIEMYNQDII